MTDKERDLRALAEAALQAENALELRDKMIRQYAREGYSLREIASHVGRSHEWVRSLISQDQT